MENKSLEKKRKEMDKALLCLSLEVPQEIYDDVKTKVHDYVLELESALRIFKWILK